MSGFISQPCTSPKTSWWQIKHLRHFWSFTTLQDGSYWARWMIVERNNLFVNFMCFKLPRKLDVRSLQRLTLPFWPNIIVLVVRTTTMWSYFYYFVVQLLSRELEYDGIFLDIWSEPSIPDVNNIWCATLWAALNKICPIWGYCAFPHKWNYGNFIIKHHMKFRWDITSFWV